MGPVGDGTDSSMDCPSTTVPSKVEGGAVASERAAALDWRIAASSVVKTWSRAARL